MGPMNVAARTCGSLEEWVRPSSAKIPAALGNPRRYGRNDIRPTDRARNRAGVALRAAFGSSSSWEGRSYATVACGSRRIRDHRSGSGHLESRGSLAERESYREPARSVPGLLQSGDCLEVPSPALVDGDGRGESGPRATPADGKRQSSGADPRPREHPSQWIPVRQRRELHAAAVDPAVAAGVTGNFYYACLSISLNSSANGIELAVSNAGLFNPTVDCTTPFAAPTTNNCWTTTFITGNLTDLAGSFEDKELISVD